MTTDAPTLDLDGYVLAVDEQFDGDDLADTRWFPFYTPHWSSRAATRARYEVSDGTLKLRIDRDTEPWSPEYDGDVRVSHLQTGQFSGPLGSPVGQHRFRAGLVVREEQDEERLWLPHFGVIEARVRAILHDILPVSDRARGLLNDGKLAGSPEPMALGTIRAPTLALSLADDRFETLDAARHIAASVPGAQLVSFPSGGHVWVGRNEEVFAAVEGFLARLT